MIKEIFRALSHVSRREGLSERSCLRAYMDLPPLLVRLAELVPGVCTSPAGVACESGQSVGNFLVCKTTPASLSELLDASFGG